MVNSKIFTPHHAATLHLDKPQYFQFFVYSSHIRVRYETGYHLKFRPDKYSLRCIYGDNVRRTLSKIYFLVGHFLLSFARNFESITIINWMNYLAWMDLNSITNLLWKSSFSSPGYDYALFSDFEFNFISQLVSVPALRSGKIVLRSHIRLNVTFQGFH